MPRRIVDYPDAFAGWNYVSSIGSYVFAFGLGATTLEWTLSSPPPFHQFENLPRIK